MWKPNRGQQVYEARQTFSRAREELRSLSRDYQEQSRAARVVPNRADLSPEGIQKAQREAQARARAAAEARVDAQRSSIASATETLRKLGETPAPDTAGELRRGRIWERTRALLEAGKSAQKIIADSTDPDELLTLRDELPAWLQAQTAQRQRGADGLRAGIAGVYERGDDASAVIHRIDQRLAEVSTGDEAAAASARVALASDASVADLHLTHVAAEVAGHGTPLATSMALQMFGGPASGE